MAAPTSQTPDNTYTPIDIDARALRKERLARLRRVLQQEDVAAAVFLDPINIRYATDVSNMQVWCLHNPTRYAFVAASGPVIQFEFANCDHLAEDIETIDEVRPATSWTNLMAGPHAAAQAAKWAAEIADLVSAHGAGNRRIAVDRLDFVAFQELVKCGVDVVDGQALAETARSIKTPQELTAIRDCVAACEAAVHSMQDVTQPGMTEQMLWSRLHQANIEQGGEWIETRLLVSGPRTNPWYRECSNRVIEAGDMVALDTDLIGRHGYCCDISRTWRSDGQLASDTQRRTYAQAFSHLQRLLEFIGPGVTMTELAEHAGTPTDGTHGYSCLIHGVGMCDEFPVGFWINQSDRYEATLSPGMTICVESYCGPDDAAEGVKLEEQVLITSDGIEVLSTLPFENDWL